MWAPTAPPCGPGPRGKEDGGAVSLGPESSQFEPGLLVSGSFKEFKGSHQLSWGIGSIWEQRILGSEWLESAKCLGIPIPRILTVPRHWGRGRKTAG